MKTLIFGIDGLGWMNLHALGLKRLAKRLEKAVVGTPKIDNVVSRGWPEIYTGKTAYETGAFYQAPLQIGEKIFPTQKTGLSYLKKVVPNNELLWNRLMNAGMTVGIFTVPTVSPPEKLNGFCVAATGAGKFGNALSKDDIYPPNLLKGFDFGEIDLGLRMGYGAYLPDSPLELEVKAKKHITIFFEALSSALERRPVNVCFAASRFVAEMAYKFLGVCVEALDKVFDQELKCIILSLCDQFDKELDDFFNTHLYENLFIVSDHGIGLFEYDLNLNQLLLEIGYIKQIKPYSNWKNFLRPTYRLYQRRILRKKIGHIFPIYDLERSTAYSIGFTNVIYLNYTSGFLSRETTLGLTQQLLQDLEKYTKKIGIDTEIKFHPINIDLENLTGFPFPVIKCDMLQGIMNTEREKSILKTRQYNYKKMFTEGFYGEHSGCKTEDTIFAYQGPRIQEINFEKLTDVYHAIINVSS